MPSFVGLDCSKATTSICVMDRDGTVLREGTVESTPKAIAGFLRGERRRYVRVGMEAWALASWLYKGLAKAGLPIVCIEAGHAHAVLRTQRNKTDRNDARGIAELMRIGVFRIVHVKSRESQETKALLASHNAMSQKRGDLDNLIRGVLLGFGLKIEAGRTKSFASRAQALSQKHPFVANLIGHLLEARNAITAAMKSVAGQLHDRARADPVCQQLMTVPGIGEITALTFRAAVDEPLRFNRSRTVGAHFGLTPKTFQSGARRTLGKISHRGDGTVRRVLFLAARSLCRRWAKSSWLKEWGEGLLARCKYKVAITAVARKLAVVMHRIWTTGTDFRWARA